MDMISILIPVYKESDLLETLLNQLIKENYKEKEIITVIDEPTENSLKTIKKYNNKVKFILNKERKGKVNALNEAAKIAKGDIFLFIDSDTIISKKSKNFLQKIEENIKNADLLEIKKEPFQRSFLSRLTTYEYIAACVCSSLFNKIKTCLGVNGSGFAITKEFFREVGGFKQVISEDLEMGIQTHLFNKKYKFLTDLSIHQKAPSNWKSWLFQRKRWSIGTAQFYRRHYKEFFSIFKKHPGLGALVLFYFYPTLLSTLLMSPLMEKTLILSLFFLSIKIPTIMPILFVTTWSLLIIKNLTVFAIMYGITSILFYIASKKLKFNYKNRDFLVYYLFYSPLFSMIFLFYFITNLFKKNQIILNDWKV